MYGLTRDFVRNGGAFMTLQKENGLHIHELSRVQLGMLTSNRIPRILPMHTREIDQNVTLQYDISGYKMLSQMLRSGQIALPVLYNLLFQLVDALEECRQYMLEPQNVWLHEEYIFIQGSVEQGELGLIYVPMTDARQEEHTPLLFRDLVIRLMAYVQELQGEGIQRVLQLCDSERWNIRQLRELLLELCTGSTIYPGVGGAGLMESGNEPSFVLNKSDAWESPVQRQPSFKVNEEAIEGENLRSKSFLHRRVAEHPYSDNSISISNDRKAKPLASQMQYPSLAGEEQEDPKEKQSGSTSGSSRTTYIWLVCMVSIALVWRFIYMEQPGRNEMLLSTSLSVGLAAAACWMWKRKAGSRSESSDPRPFLITALSRRKNKQPRNEDGMYQENWRWNAPEKSGEAANLHQELSSAISEKEASTFSRSSNVHAGVKTMMTADIPAAHSLHTLSVQEHNARTGTGTGTSAHTSKGENVYSSLDDTSELSGKAVAAEATVNLQQLAALGAGRKSADVPVYYLERTSQEGVHSERVDVRGTSFVIGRAADMVQCVDNATGVSRAHVELSRSPSGGYVIKDLGSVNGTMLQGNLMAPYKEYPLADGDTFILAESVYVYRVAE
ncbi:FHA domain-containing protein [Paenibacillus barcinonensis]|uniref:FHA domain-containing protein n=2 Tax=Paenibacillus barcinonensis TaxID=198119 RepID=A0A2V4VH27_PAEBA|nr:FHA domain-containing protein [Paenibacillus barcinonensis]